VGKDACHYAGSEVERGASGNTVGYRRLTRLYRFHKGFEFGAERLGFRRGQFFKGKLGLRAGAFDTDSERVAARVVQRNIFVLLEEAHFADAFGGDAAGGDVGDGAAGEFQASVGDVDFIGEHRDAHGFHFGDGLLDDGEQNVQIVDHQIKDNVNIEAARGENAQAVHFEKERAVDDGLDGNYRGIEALDVADLQNALVAPGGSGMSAEKKMGGPVWNW